MTAGQVSGYAGVAVLLDDLPRAERLLGNRNYDADWFRDTPAQRRPALHRASAIPEQARQVWGRLLSAPQPHPDHVRPPQGPASCRDPLRSLSN